MREHFRWRFLLWFILWLPLIARSDVVPPPEFWDYLADFGDQEGELFDPLDLTEAETIVRPNTDSTQTELKTQPQEESQP